MDCLLKLMNLIQRSAELSYFSYARAASDGGNTISNDDSSHENDDSSLEKVLFFRQYRGAARGWGAAFGGKRRGGE